MERLKTISRAPIAFGAVENEFTAQLSLENNIQSLNILQDRRILLTGVFEVYRPFDGLEIVIFDTHTAQLQPSVRVTPNEEMLAALVIELARRTLLFPLWQPLIRRFAGVRKRKERLIEISCVFEIDTKNLIAGETADFQTQQCKK